jgi:Zn-finger nucleic acid-binding protein
VELDLCIKGKGIWFDADELRQLFTILELPDGVSDLEHRLKVMERAKGQPKRKCPRCDAIMDLIDAPGPKQAVILDRCPNGHGLWFDHGELHEILSAELGPEDKHLETVRRHLGQFMEPRKETRS